MKKHFKILWHKIERYPIDRISIVEVLSETDDVGTNCQRAVDLFIANNGSLKRNEIVEIWELDENGDTIGEVIKPISDSIVPMETKPHK